MSYLELFELLKILRAMFEPLDVLRSHLLGKISFVGEML